MLQTTPKPMLQQTDGAAPLHKRAWEVFCASATGFSGGDPITATDAYLAAYPNTNRNAARANAARLAARPDVIARCDWMRKQLAQSILMDSAAIRAKITGLRLDIINKTQNTCHKDLALAAARDLEKGLGLIPDSPSVEVTVGSKSDVRDTVTGNIASALAVVQITVNKKEEAQ